MNWDESTPYVCTLTPELIKKAQEELNEKAEWRLRDIQALRDMVNAHPGLKTRTDDAFLLRFLRARKFDYDRAYQMLLSYYQIRAENDTVFCNIRPSSVKHLMDRGVTTVLPHRDHEGRRIIYFRPGRWDPSECPIYDMLKLNLITFEKIIEEEETQVNGIVFVADAGEVTMMHAKNIDRNYAKLMSAVLQDCFPMRLKGLNAVNEPTIFGYIFSIMKPFLKEKTRDRDNFPLRMKGAHVVNEPIVFGCIFAIVKPFMKEKLTSRMQFHGSNLESLHKVVPKACLPEEAGGTLGPISELSKVWNEQLAASEDTYVAMEQYKLDVPKQIMKKKNEEIVDCLIGTYRKLNVE